VAAFPTTCTDHLRAAIPPDNTRPVKVFSQDASRCRLLTVRRCRVTARGVQPIGTIQHVFDWFYVYGAVAPTTGQSFFFELPQLNRTHFQVFLDAFARAFPDSLDLLVLDKSEGTHRQTIVHS
jgi:hypothetical protein